jgi:hypothetical protein
VQLEINCPLTLKSPSPIENYVAESTGCPFYFPPDLILHQPRAPCYFPCVESPLKTIPANSPRIPADFRPVFVSVHPFEVERIAAAAVYCSDGRFGEQMDEFLHIGLGLPRYDRVAVPGGAACLAGHVNSYHDKASLERQLAFLIKEHGLKKIVLIAHEGCAYYKDIWTTMRSIAEQQAEDLKRAADHIRMWNSGVEISAYFARKIDGKVAFEQWSVASLNSI